MVINVQPGQIIHLGRYTSSQQVTVVFDVSGWADLLVSGTSVRLLYGLVDRIVTPQVSYTAEQIIANNYKVEWPIGTSVTDYVGEGHCELALFDSNNNHTALSYYWQTVVSDSIYNNDTTTPDAVYQNYIDRLSQQFSVLDDMEIDTTWVSFNEEGRVESDASGEVFKLHFYLPKAPQFSINRSYASLNLMYADYKNCLEFDFCIIDDADPEHEENAQLYMVDSEPDSSATYTVELNVTQLPASPVPYKLYVLANNITSGALSFKKYDVITYVNGQWEKAFSYLTDMSGMRGYTGTSIEGARITNDGHFEFKYVTPSTGASIWSRATDDTFYSNIIAARDSTYAARDVARSWATGSSTGTPSPTNNALYYANQASLWATNGTGGSPNSTNNAKYFAELASTSASIASEYMTSASYWANEAYKWAESSANHDAKYWAGQANNWATTSTNNNAKYWATQANNWATLSVNNNAKYWAEQASASNALAAQWATGGSTGTPSSTNNALYYANKAALWTTGSTTGTPTSTNNAWYYADLASASATNASTYATIASVSATSASTYAAAAKTSAASASTYATAASASAISASTYAANALAASNSASGFMNWAQAWAEGKVGSTVITPTHSIYSSAYAHNALYWATQTNSTYSSAVSIYDSTVTIYGSITSVYNSTVRAYNSTVSASNSAYSASLSASTFSKWAEAWADGTVNGTAITSTGTYSSAFNNNAKYWAQLWSHTFDAWSSPRARIKINPSTTQPLSSAYVTLYEQTDPVSGNPYKEFYFEMPFNTGININKVYTYLPSNAEATQLGEGAVIAVGTEKPYTLYISNGYAWVEAGEYGINDIDGQKGQPNGLAELDGAGLVPASQLPSYVDDVLEFNTRSDFPATGESGKVYIAKDTNVTYRWGGTTYATIGSDLALGETSSTAYRGDRGKAAYDHATEAARLSTAQTLGFYKVATTAQGHIGQVSVVTASDITALSLPYMQKGVDYVTAGQLSGTTLGTKATAEGLNTTASGNAAHAEGQDTTALGISSHAEGNGGATVLVVSGDANATTYLSPDPIDSLSEGQVIRYNNNYATIIYVDKVHRTFIVDQTLSTTALSNAIVYLTPGAFDLGAHSEGLNTTATAPGAHAEGSRTIAYGYYQHVVGKFNEVPTNYGDYVELVGNGNSSSRSNARTLDWSGNEWVAGTIKVGGTNYDDANAKELATKDYVDSHTQTFVISEGTLYL